ncbi:ATPase, partial [bacterium]|nr:ATPase [bacterium]
MYEEYWGLKEKPFENTPDPRFLYYSPKHEEALTRLLYAIREKKGAAILTGGFGAGKTVLSR